MDMWEPKWSVTKKRSYYFNAATGKSLWTAPAIINTTNLVAEHYNTITTQVNNDSDTRDNSKQLRAFNNWIKAWLIHTYGQHKMVLDLACGRGQDINKWTRVQTPHYIGVDISTIAITEAKRRAPSQGFKFFCADLAEKPFNFNDFYTHPSNEHPYDAQPRDIVSCMFAFHYFWKTEKMLRCFLVSVISNLKAGGKVLLTFPNVGVLKHHLTLGTVNNGIRTASNGLFQITMEEQYWQALPFADTDHAFGWPYSFTLPGAVDACLEYFVIMPVLEQILREFQLTIVKLAPFQELYHELFARSEFIQQIHDMRVLDTNGTIPTLQWECVGLYQALVLEFQPFL